MKQNAMTENHKFIAGLLLGAVAGVALLAFLNSEKGKELIGEVQERTDKMQDDLKVKLQEFDMAVTDLLERGKTFIDDFEQKARQSSS